MAFRKAPPVDPLKIRWSCNWCREVVLEADGFALVEPKMGFLVAIYDVRLPPVAAGKVRWAQIGAVWTVIGPEVTTGCRFAGGVKLARRNVLTGPRGGSVPMQPT